MRVVSLGSGSSGNALLVEAGATLAGELLHAGLADELLLYVAPRLLGPGGRPLVALPEPRALEAAPSFSLIDTLQLGEDLRLRLRPGAAPGG